MAQTKADQGYLAFVSRLTDLLSNYTPRDLRMFLDAARRGVPSMFPVIEACIEMVESAPRGTRGKSVSIGPSQIGIYPERLHLFDLLRSRDLFPSNADLALFAARVVPKMTRKRFGKMSRSDIAVRIIDYLETLDLDKRRRLEDSMRKAIDSISAGLEGKPESFFLQWEKIIKAIRC